MSQHVKPKLIIEWSPANVLAFSPGSGKVNQGETVAAAAKGFSGGDVLVALSRRASFVRTTRVPNASHDDVSHILRMQIGGLFPVSGDELAYDFQLTDDVTGDGRLAMVAAVQAEQLRQLHEECKAAGLKVSAVVPSAIGSVELMRTMGVREAAVVQVDEQGASIDVVSQGVLKYSRWTAATKDVLGEVRRTFAAAGIESLPILAASGSNLEADYHSSQSTLLALSNIDLAKPPLNIELGEVVAHREATAKRNSFVLSGAVLAMGIMAAGYIGFNRYSITNQVNAAVAKKTKDVTDFNTHADRSTSELNAKIAQFQVVDRGFAPPQRFYEIMAILTSDAPTGVWLTGISMERGRPFTVRGTAMNADQISDFTKTLANEERFRNVVLQFSSNSEIDNRPVVQFSITGFPNGNLPLVDTPSSGSVAPSTPPQSSSTTTTTTTGSTGGVS